MTNNRLTDNIFIIYVWDICRGDLVPNRLIFTLLSAIVIITFKHINNVSNILTKYTISLRTIKQFLYQH